MSNNSWTIARKRTDSIKYMLRSCPKYNSTKFINNLPKTHKFINKVGECAGYLKNAQNYECISIFVPLAYTHMKKEKDFKEWIKFINELEFPCHYMGKSKGQKDLGLKESYVVNMYMNEYPERGYHLLACHTIIRYSYSDRYKKISKFALKLHKEYDLPHMKALYLAHYSEINNNRYKAYYGLLQDNCIKKSNKKFVYPPDHLGVQEALIKKGVNSSFDNSLKKKLPKIDGKIQPLTDKNIEKYIKALKL